MQENAAFPFKLQTRNVKTAWSRLATSMILKLQRLGKERTAFIERGVTSETGRVDGFSGRNSVFPESFLRSLDLNVRKQKARGQFCDTQEKRISSLRDISHFRKKERCIVHIDESCCERVLKWWQRGGLLAPLSTGQRLVNNSWGRRNRLCAECCTYVEIMGSGWKKIWLWTYSRNQ
jgi:hypothetical protein